MKAWFLILALAATSACASTPVQSQASIDAIAATRTIQSLDLIRDFAIGANQQGLLSVQTTTNIVFYHEEALKAIHTLTGITSWKSAVLSGFGTLVASFTPAEKQLLQPYIDIVTAVLNGVV